MVTFVSDLYTWYLIPCYRYIQIRIYAKQTTHPWEGVPGTSTKLVTTIYTQHPEMHTGTPSSVWVLIFT